MFKLSGINAAKIDRLAENTFESNRKDEILNWYNETHCSIDHFVLIDDDKTFNGLPDNINANWVLTSSSVGLSK